MTSFLHQKIGGRLIIAGREADAAAIHVEYAVNEVPVGWATLAVGYDAVTGTTAPDMTDKLGEQIPIVAELSIGDVTHTIFDGKISGPSWRRSAAAAGLQVGMANWMDDLRSTSALSKAFGTSTPGDFTAASCLQIGKDGPAGKAGTYFNAESLGLSYVGLVTSDLWAAVSAALMDLTKTPLLSQSGDKALYGGGLAKPLDNLDNTLARVALARFTGGPLPISGLTGLPVRSIAAALAQIIFMGGGGPTVWSMLATLAETFSFSILPGVKTAKAAPVLSFVNSALAKYTIMAEDYIAADRTQYSRYPVRGVALMGTERTASNPQDERATELVTTLARFVTTKPGVIETRRIPSWIDNAIRYDEWTAVTTGAEADGVRANGEDRVSVDVSVNSDINTARRTSLGARMAQAAWLDIAFAGRSIRVISKLRVDIGPGTPVKIDIAGQRGAVAKTVCGVVNRVSLDVDVQNSSAYTTFDIVGVHGVAEDDLSASIHPFFGNLYAGGSLV